uniref:small subunit processome component 20 homolog n=1 Tax=Erigeron canadensis TaxID=72917 RepID=UPI001CB8DD95|nr:small subunit processome component 20 homolog [Erigeron canadensis]
MATQSHAQAVKSLNRGPGRKRFVFKTFAQRVEEIDVDVYRSLDPIKQDPSEGSSFFRDCLVEWRELNTAEDFISFYDEMLPLVQTLPQIILQKEIILSNLLSRLDMKGRLSLEPILRLIAALSRDLLEDFIPFMKRVVDSLVLLLTSGADREPELIEQILTSWSYIVVYLQKYLTRDVVHVLRVTSKLRFYPKQYVQELMADSVSFLLRTAPVEQLNRGVRKVMSEVVTKPLEIRKSGVSALLFYVMKGSSTMKGSSKLHSRATHVVQLLLNGEIIGRGDKDHEGSNPVVEVVIMVFQRFCGKLLPELKLLLQHEVEEIYESISNGHLFHLCHLLSVLISTMQIDNVHQIIEFEPVLALIKVLVDTYIVSSSMLKAEDQPARVADKVLQLMLCILDGLHSGNNMEAVTELSTQWAPIFVMRNKSFLTFIKELLSKDASIVQAFSTSITTALTELTMTLEDEAMYLLIKFLKKMKNKSSCLLEEKSRRGILSVCIFLKEHITCWLGKINDAVHKDLSSMEFMATDLAWIWGIMKCYSYMTDSQADPSLIMDFVEALDRFLKVNCEIVGGLPRQTWESLLGACLSSYRKLSFGQMAKNDELPIDKFLYFAKRYKSSIHILSAVAKLLDSIDECIPPADARHKKYLLELEAGKTVDAFSIFSENLCSSDKQIRLFTLKILCHYESLNSETAPNVMIDDSQNNVLHSFLDIENTSLSIATSRKVVLLITRIQADLKAGRICEAYIPLVFYSIVGIFHNRFNLLWHPATECFALLVSNYHKLVWELCVKYLEKCVSIFVSHQEHSDRCNGELHDSHDDLSSWFNKFATPSYDDIPSPTVVSLIIKSLQKIPTFAESRSRQIIPLFLKFLGYEVADLSSVRSYSLDASKGKEWKGVLVDWLNLVKLMHNPKAFYLSQFLKEVLQYRLLDENDPELQLKVLDCLLNWKDEFLVPYDQNLRNLVNPKTLRDELTRWSLSRESHLVSEQHRDCLVPLVIRLLVPKVRKLKTLASRKAASVHHRKAVIGFLAELDINELPLFFALLTKPLYTGSLRHDDMDELLWSSPKAPASLNFSRVLRHFTSYNIKSLSSKKIYGFLHVTEEILGVFDVSRIEPVLDTLMAIVVRILVSCAPSIDNLENEPSQAVSRSNKEDDGTEKQAMTSFGPKQFKDLRSLCLKIVSFVLCKFENHDFTTEFWDTFFSALKPLIDGFKQEGASSEKPSSLFVCFLAMSRSHKLVSLFHRANNLVPDIFSILTVATASEAIISCVLRFIENLLNLDTNLENGSSDVKGILLPSVDMLVCSLHQLFTCKNPNRKSFKSSRGRELSIFKLLPKYIKDTNAGSKFIDILLPSLAKKPHDPDSCVEILHVIQKMIPMLEKEGSLKILNAISPLLIHATSDLRLAICGIIDVLAGTDPSLVLVAKLLHEFSATSTTEMDVLDYDVINGAYEKINIEFFCSVRKEHALIILSHCVHDMSSHDLILRNGAYRLLLLFVDFCSKILSRELVSYSGFWSDACIKNTINNFILKYMGHAMNKGTSVKQVWMDLLRIMVEKLPNVSNLASYRALCNEAAEKDFFYNIFHVQKLMRGKALLHFSSVIKEVPLSEVVTNKVLVPLLFSMLLEVKDGKSEHLNSGCIEALASISGSMEWKQYYALLNRCFKELKLKPERQKLFLRLICSILDHFHFSEVKLDVSMVLDKCTTTDKHSDIQTSLRENILPKVQKLLSLDTDNVNVNVSLLALKLFKLLSGNILEVQLPTIIHRVSNFLKSRLESVRDEARYALVACLKELGIEYLQFILKVLRSTLKRGFELHVLGYTLNFILLKCSSGSALGKLDYFLDELLSVAEDDILGDVSLEKEVEQIASKMKETRKKKSFGTLKLIAQNITFKTHALKLISPIKRHLQKPLTPIMKSKLKTMLDHIASGFECNKTVSQEDILIFTYGLIEDGASGNQHHLITVFALGILHKRIKKMKFKENQEQVLSFLDPFVGLLCGCLSSKYEDITSESLWCLSFLLKAPLPSLDLQADNIKNALFVILHGSVNASSQLAESCIRLLTLLLKSTSSTLPFDQIRMLLQFPLFVDLERYPSFIALSLLEAIVNRKVVVPEIYDLAKIVAELMVTNQVESIRKKCSEIFLSFLINYDLSQKRLQQHLDFLLANLRYEHSSGREAVLEMLYAVIKKLPSEFVNEQSQTLFVQLVVCLANDSDKEVRAMTGAAIKVLIGRVGSQNLQLILENTFAWFSGENQGLWSAAAQVLGLLVEVMKSSFSKHIHAIIPVMRHIFLSSVNVIKNGQIDLSSVSTMPLWKEAYYSMVLFEKILVVFQGLFSEKDLEDMWELISEFLLHPHIWLRDISSRLIAMYFKRVSKARMRNNEDWMGNYFLMRPSRLYLLAVSFCSQLKASLTNESANDCLRDNIVFVLLELRTMFGQQEDTRVFWSSFERKDKEVFLRAFVILDSSKGLNAQCDLEKIHQSLLISSLLEKMGKIALDSEEIQMRIVIDIFKLIYKNEREDWRSLDEKDGQTYAYQVLLPLHKICDGFAGKVISDDVKRVAQEALNVIRDVIGIQNFNQVYNSVRSKLKTKRDKRKQGEKIMAVVDPMKNAKRKLRIAEKHKVNKKRKIMTMKFGRWVQ